MNLNLPKEVDKTSTEQKIVAGILLSAVLYLLYYILPPIVVILKNLWLTALLGIPLLFFIYNYEIIWHLFKTISWYFTKWVLSLDLMSALERYYDWLSHKIETIKETRSNLRTTFETLDQQIKQKELSFSSNMRKANKFLEGGNQLQSAIYSSNAVDDKNFVTDLSPIRDNTNDKLKYMDELVDVLSASKQQLRYKIDSLKLKYESLTNIHKGMQMADNVIGDSTSKKLFEETVKQVTNEMNHMTANIEMFEKNIKPVLDDSKIEVQMKAEEGRVLLEEFKKSQLQLQEIN